jgi:anti-sigma factor RsiW
MSLDCQQVPDAAADLLGGEASPACRAALARHLADCPACAASLDQLDGLIGRARSHALAVPEPPPEYWHRFGTDLRRRIAADRAASWGGLLASWLRPLLAAAAVASLTFVVAGRPAPHRGLGPQPVVAAIEAATAGDVDPSDLGALAAGLDVIGSGAEATSAELLDPAAAGAADAFVRRDPSGDVFGFFESTEPLTREQTTAILAALERRFAG